MSDNSQDYIDTQILESDNKAVNITQDIVVTSIVSGLIEDSVRGTVYELGGKQALQAGFKKYDAKFTKEMFEKLQKTASKKLQGNITKRIGQMLSRRAAKGALRSLGKSVGTTAARSGTIAAGGCTLGPAGCAAGAAIGGIIFIADLAFTIYSTILDIKDKDGILNIFHKEYIDNIIKDYETAMREGFADVGYPDAFDEEVLFYPEFFVYDFDATTGNISMDPENKWAQKYVQYRDEYFKNIGVKDGWEDRLEAQSLYTDIDELTQGIDLPEGTNKKTVLVMSSFISSILCSFLFSVLLLT